MTWQGDPAARPSVRISSLGPSLQRTERKVVEAIIDDRDLAIESTAQQLADRVGVGRTTVIRAAQSLGYEGYPQFRVALAQEVALDQDTLQAAGPGATALDLLRARVTEFGSKLGDSLAALTPASVDRLIEALDTSNRVLVVANGLSSPLGLDLVMRLTAAGRAAEYFADPIGQQIAARHLGPGSICVVISGSGTNQGTLDAMTAGKRSGAELFLITSFSRSAAVELADVSLVVPPSVGGFREELVHTSRAALMLLTEMLVEALERRRGEAGRAARAASLEVLAGSLRA